MTVLRWKAFRLEGILFVLQTGVPWEKLPAGLGSAPGSPAGGGGVPGSRAEANCTSGCWACWGSMACPAGHVPAWTWSVSGLKRGRADRPGPHRPWQERQQNTTFSSRSMASPLAIAITGANRPNSISWRPNGAFLPAIGPSSRAVTELVWVLRDRSSGERRCRRSGWPLGLVPASNGGGTARAARAGRR